MNKSELIEALSQEINVPLREADSITNTILDAMTDALAAGDSIEIRGFGSFVVKEYGSYQGRNPKTGEEVPILPRKVLVFRPSQVMKTRINSKRKPGQV